MIKKNILIVSANFFPVLGPRAHRATELSKELARQGHRVDVLTLKGGYNYADFTNLYNVNVHSLGISKFGLVDNAGKSNQTFFKKALRKLLSKALYMPYIEHVYLVNKCLRHFLGKDIDTLITIAHPHSIHWGAALFLRRERSFCRLWIADCGDPFMLDPLNSYPFYFRYLEKLWCKQVDFITVPIASAENAYYEEFRHKIKVIPQGFDFSDIKLSEYVPNGIPTFAYSGFFYPKNRDPTRFLEYLTTVKEDFKFIIYTKTKSILRNYVGKLDNKLIIRDYVPRAQLLLELSKMDFLINIRNNSEVQQPSKLIDYALTQRPMIEISSAFEEQEIFEEFLTGDYSGKRDKIQIENYDIRNVVTAFLELIYTVKQ